MAYNQQYILAGQMHQAQLAANQVHGLNLQVVQQQHQPQPAAAPAAPAHPDPAMQAAQLEMASGSGPAPNTNALAIRRPFDPTAHDLDANFRLTRFADLKG